MKLTVLSLITGVITGLLFSLLKLPLPAPPTLPGVVGIIGIYLGFRLVEIIPFLNR